MYCHKCGKEIPDDADYCPYCGAEVIYKPKTPSKRIEDEEGYISFGVDENGDSLRTDPTNQKTTDGKIVTNNSSAHPYRDKKWSIATLAIYFVVTIILVFTPIFKGEGSILTDYHIDEAAWMYYLFAIIFIDIAFYMVGYALVTFLNPSELRPSQQARIQRGYKVGIIIAATAVIIVGIVFLALGLSYEDLSVYGVVDTILAFAIGVIYLAVVLFEQCDILHNRK